MTLPLELSFANLLSLGSLLVAIFALRAAVRQNTAALDARIHDLERLRTDDRVREIDQLHTEQLVTLRMQLEASQHRRDAGQPRIDDDRHRVEILEKQVARLLREKLQAGDSENV